MTQKLGIKFETVSEERRDMFVHSLIGLLNALIAGDDKAEITFTDERPTFRGKKKITTTTTWEDGQAPPTLWDIGIHATQHDLFSSIYSSEHGTGTGLSNGSTTVDDQIAQEPTDAEAQLAIEQLDQQRPAIDDADPDLGPFR